MPSDPQRHELITRRDAILRVSAMLGGVALVGQSAMLAGCDGGPANETQSMSSNAPFSQTDIELLDEIADTIIPETSTPGAKAAGVGSFVALMVADTYYEDDQQIFRTGLQTLQAKCQDTHGAEFEAVTPERRLRLLEDLDAEQHQYMETREKGAPSHYFRMLKELTLLGYFTSEIGYTRALRYKETPGRFEPCAPYTPGEKAWADHA
jgi:hypothetical protein